MSKISDKELNEEEKESISDNITKYIMEGFYEEISSGTQQIQKTSITNGELKTEISNYETLRVFSMKDDGKFANDLVPDETVGIENKKSDFFLNDNDPKLKSISGFEEVIAQCIIGGERIFGAGYIGVEPEENGEYKVFKATHSSKLQLQTEPVALINDLFNDFEIGNYSNLTFNIDKFHKAMEDVTKISEEKIQEIVEKKVDDLKKANIKIEGIKFDLRYIELDYGNKDQTSKILKHSEYEYISQYFKIMLLENLKISKQLITYLDVIKNIDKGSKQTEKDYQEFRNQGWLNEIKVFLLNDYTTDPLLQKRKLGRKNPIAFAVSNKRKIAGKDPIAWKRKNEIKNRKDEIKNINIIDDPKKLTDSYFTLADAEQKSLLSAVKKKRAEIVITKASPTLHKFSARQIVKMMHDNQITESYNNTRADLDETLDFSKLKNLTPSKSVDAKTREFLNSKNDKAFDEILNTINTQDLNKMIEVEKLLKEKGNSQSLKESCTRTWGEFFRGYKKIKNTDLSQIATEMVKNNKDLESYVNEAQLKVGKTSKDLAGNMIKKLMALNSSGAYSSIGIKKKNQSIEIN